MRITEVRVRLVSDRNERLKAFCCITIDDEFVVRDIKVIDGSKGLFVAMPSRKITDHCPTCGGKNPLRASYCNECGGKLKGGKFDEAAALGDKLHADVAHPINSECRGRISRAIIGAYEEELKRSSEPGYRPPRGVSDDDDDYHPAEDRHGIGSRVSGGGDDEVVSEDSAEAKTSGGFAEGIL